LQYGAAAFREYIERHGRSSLSASRLPLARLVSGNAAHGVPPLPDALIADEVTIIMFAGTDTTATTLTYLFFELARHPQWYARLRAEVMAARPLAPRQSPPPAPPAPTYAALQQLPVLNAVLWETLRMYPPVPYLPREAPRGGAPVTGAGAWLPPGTVVWASAYTVQRNADVFPQPDAWEPARWLAFASAPSVPLFSSRKPRNGEKDGGHDDDYTLRTADAGSKKQQEAGPTVDVPIGSGEAANAKLRGEDGGGRRAVVGEEGEKGDDREGKREAYTIYEDEDMRAHMNVFGRGVHACLGKTIALVEMKHAAAALAQRFSAVRLADEQKTVEDMRLVDRFVMVPKGKRCRLVFS
jgi:cytochrome P450